MSGMKCFGLQLLLLSWFNTSVTQHPKNLPRNRWCWSLLSSGQSHTNTQASYFKVSLCCSLINSRLHIYSTEYERSYANAKSWPEAVIEHLVGRQGQPRGAQVCVMQCTWVTGRGGPGSSPPRPHFRVGSGGEGILPAWGLPKVSGFSSFVCVHSCCVWTCSDLLQPRVMPLCYYCCAFHHIMASQWYRRLPLTYDFQLL